MLTWATSKLTDELTVNDALARIPKPPVYREVPISILMYRCMTIYDYAWAFPLVHFKWNVLIRNLHQVAGIENQ